MQYYVSQPILYNSLIGSSAFVLASVEIEIEIEGRQNRQY